MPRPLAFATALGVLLSLAAPLVVTAHEPGENEIEVEPGEVVAGGGVVLVGIGLEPDTDRVLVLAGQDLIVEFGSVATDAEGSFRVELTIPSHLPPGIYELRAIGDETLTTPLEVTVAGSPDAASPPPNEADETIVPRDRTPIELGLILAFVALAIVAGGFLVWRAERFRGGATT